MSVLPFQRCPPQLLQRPFIPTLQAVVQNPHLCPDPSEGDRIRQWQSWSDLLSHARCLFVALETRCRALLLFVNYLGNCCRNPLFSSYLVCYNAGSARFRALTVVTESRCEPEVGGTQIAAMKTEEGKLGLDRRQSGILAITLSCPCSRIIDWGDGQLDLWSPWPSVPAAIDCSLP